MTHHVWPSRFDSGGGGSGSITFTALAYTRPADGNNPSISNDDIVTSGTTGPYYLDVLSVTNGTTPSQTDMNNGSGTGVLEKQTLGPQSNIGDLDGDLDLNVSITNGRIYQQYRDSDSNLSALTSTPTADSITYDSAASTFSSAEVGNQGNSTVRVTFNKSVFDPDNAVVAGDFTLTGNTITAVSVPGTTYVDLTLGTAATGSDVYTGDLDYTGNDLVNLDGETVATFANQDVTNNVGGGGIPTDASRIEYWTASNVTTDGDGLVQLDGNEGAFDLIADHPNCTIQSADLNGEDTMAFDGTGGAPNASLTSLPATFAIHAVIAPGTINQSNDTLISMDATNDFQLDSGNASQWDGRFNPSGIGTQENLTGGPYSGWLNISIIFDRTSEEIYTYIGNTLRATSTGYTTDIDASQTLRVFVARNGSTRMDGELAELIITSNITNRSAYYSYLNTKYGVS